MPWLGLAVLFFSLVLSFSRAESAFDSQLLRSPDPEAVASAVDRFRAEPDARALPVLFSLLTNADPFLRREAARGLGALSRADVRKALEKSAREDPDLGVRSRAVLSLKEQGVGGPLRQLTDELTERLSDPEEPGRSALIRALSALGSKRAIPHLKKIVRDSREDLSLRTEAASGLAELQDKSLFPLLLTLLRSKSEGDRLVAITGLGVLGDRRAVPFLMKTIDDRSAMIRQETVSALGKLGDPRPAPQLRRRLKSDEVQEVRRAAALALGKMKDAEALPLIRSGLWDGGTASDREWALRAWTEYEDPRVLPWLEEGVIERPLALEPRKEALRKLIALEGRAGREFVAGIAASTEIEPALKEIAQAAVGGEAVAETEAAILRSPESSIGFLPASADRPLILYRGPLLPLFQYEPDRDTWTPYPDQDAFVRSRAPAALPFEIREEALIVKEGQDEMRYPFPEGAGPVLVAPDRAGETLWWGGKGMLGRFDPAQKQFVVRRPRALDGAKVVSFSIDRDLAWIGWERENRVVGLLRLDLKGTEEVLFDPTDSGILNGPIQSILPDGNRLWLAQPGGVVRFDPASREGEAYRFVEQGAETLTLRQHLAPIEPIGLYPLERWEEEMDGPDPTRRIEAIRRLGVLKDPDAIPKLLARLDEGTAPEAQRAAWALAEIGSPRSVGPLVDLLMMAPPERIVSYLTTLGEVGRSLSCRGRCGDAGEGTASFPAYRFPDLGPILLFLDHPKAEVVAQALSTLGKIGDRRAAPLLNHFLPNRDPRIAQAAAEGLQRLVEKTGSDPLESTPVEGAVEGMLDRLRAEPPDLRALESDLTSLEYKRMLAALYRLGTPGLPLPLTFGAPLTRFLGVEDRDVRWGAIPLFEKFGSDAGALLQPFLDHAREEIRRDAVRALSRTAARGGQGPDLLIFRLQRESAPAVRGDILTALAPLLKDERWRERVRLALTGVFRFDPQPQSRRRALLILSGAGIEPPWQDLVGTLRVKDDALRTRVIERMIQSADRLKNLSAGVGGGPSPDEMLEGILRESPGNTVLKRWVLRLVETAGLRSLSETLIAVLPDQVLSVRLATEELLGRLGEKQALPVLIQRAEMGDAPERYVCLSGLKRLGHSLNNEEEAWLAAGPP